MLAVIPAIAGRVVRVAEDQPGYEPVSVVLGTDNMYRCPNGLYNTVVMAFQLTLEERKRIIDGEDLYVSLLTYGEPQQGIRVLVGEKEMAAMLDSIVQ